jgi:hypothetical protein
MDYDGSVAKPMLTLYQAADRLGVGPWVVRQLIRRGLLVVWADDRDRNGFFRSGCVVSRATAASAYQSGR